MSSSDTDFHDLWIWLYEGMILKKYGRISNG